MIDVHMACMDGRDGFAREASPAWVRPIAPSNSATLAGLAQRIGPPVVRFVSVPRGLDVQVQRSVIHDPLFSGSVGADTMALMVGTALDDAAVPGLLLSAGSRGVSALAFRAASAATVPESTLAAAEASGVALVIMPAEMSWETIEALLEAALQNLRVDESALGPTATQSDLFSMANELSEIFEGSVTISDPQFTMVAYSTNDATGDDDSIRREAILRRRIPSAWVQHLRDVGMLERLWSGQVAEHEPDAKHSIRRRLVVRCHAGEHLGFLGVVEGASPLKASAPSVLRKAASAVSLQLAHERALQRADRQDGSEHARAALEGRESARVLASQLSAAADEHFAVLGMRILGDRGEERQNQERALGLLRTYCRAFRQRAVLTSIGDVNYLILASSRKRDAELLSLGKHIVDHTALALKGRPIVGVGTIVSELTEITQSRHAADRVLTVLADRRGAMTVASIDSVSNSIIVAELQALARDRPHLLVGKVQALLEYDAEHGASFVSSVRAYLAAFGDVQIAADELHVHANTLRYRLRRVKELSGLDLADPEERLIAELQLKLLCVEG